MKKRNIIIIIIFIFVIAISSILFAVNYNERRKLNEKEEVVYGIIKTINPDSVLIENTDTKEIKTYIFNPSGLNINDLIAINYKGNQIYKVDVVLSSKDAIIVDDTRIEEVTTTTSINNTTTTVLAPNTTSKVVVRRTEAKTTTTKVATTTSAVSRDDVVLNYVVEEYNQASSNDTSITLKERAKNGFITIVDFIFYDGTIKGYTFDQLKDSTKSKVVYYALLIDSKIDSKFPGYKETIGNKYKDIKASLVAKFLDIKYYMCEKSEAGCEQAKQDFALLKKSLGLTWDVVKSIAGKIKDMTVPRLKSWYESFRG